MVKSNMSIMVSQFVIGATLFPWNEHPHVIRCKERRRYQGSPVVVCVMSPD